MGTFPNCSRFLIKNIFYFRMNMQQQIIKGTFHLVPKRDNVCNFLKRGSFIGGLD